MRRRVARLAAFASLAPHEAMSFFHRANVVKHAGIKSSLAVGTSLFAGVVGLTHRFFETARSIRPSKASYSRRQLLHSGLHSSCLAQMNLWQHQKSSRKRSDQQGKVDRVSNKAFELRPTSAISFGATSGGPPEAPALPAQSEAPEDVGELDTLLQNRASRKHPGHLTTVWIPFFTSCSRTDHPRCCQRRRSAWGRGDLRPVGRNNLQGPSGKSRG